MKQSGVNLNQTYIVLVSMISALGGLLFGFDTAIISGTISYIQPYFELNEFSLGWAVSSILIGCALGALMAGKLSDIWGRRITLMICAFLFAATGIGTGLAKSLEVFVGFRILSGLAVGTAAMVGPMYIAETVPASLRGRMVSLYQLAIVSGILMAYLSNYLLSGIGENNWRWMFASQAFPSALFFLLLFFVPESPRWLVKKARSQEAQKILEKVGGIEYCRIEIVAIEESFQHETKEKLSTLWLPSYRSVLWIGIVIAVFQQITGINAIVYYAPEIIKYTGVSNENALLQTIGIGVMMFLFTLVAIWLVDKAGRRMLLLAGCAVMGLSLIGVAACFHFSYFDHYLVLIFLMLYIAGFSASLGAVTWVLLSEIFPNRIRALALSLSTLILWVADFAASFSFPVLNEKLGVAATLMIFAALCGIYFFYIKWKVPETKGQTLEALEKLLTK
ncbi:sugar porter family MFS transporter [Pedobacter nyackensis]|uniref:MFS transporter, SP family, arabinose:H+ symporter n=1 Tax=Pedobacter nyackensis TaxID=475255 RepID=A0A1W2DWP2_9SPHI|nr:sugar porter family MFS transporter [Pedobacter nyackensis]SMD01995.1 MFS transporter, SP family, arabinose:H+ symporter [Pedobacter nyackensis]